MLRSALRREKFSFAIKDLPRGSKVPIFYSSSPIFADIFAQKMHFPTALFLGALLFAGEQGARPRRPAGKVEGLNYLSLND